jgi:hypothetical protein
MYKYLILLVILSSSSFAQTGYSPCKGVNAGLGNNACIKLSADQKTLSCNSTDKEIVEIDSLGWVVQYIPAGTCSTLYNASQAQYRTNEKRVMPEFTFKPFNIDPAKIPENPHQPSPSVVDPEGVIAVRALTSLRNWETDDADSDGASSEAVFDNFGIWIMPAMHLAEQARAHEIEFDVWGNLFPMANKEFIYGAKGESAREHLATLLRDEMDKTVYPEMKIMGPYLNEKTGLHWLWDSARGQDTAECEWVGCDITGPQVSVYNDTYGIAKWSDFKSLQNTDSLIFMAKAGDGGASKDDILFYFHVSVSLLKEGRRLLYVQKNPKNGTDFIFIFELVKNS